MCFISWPRGSVLTRHEVWRRCMRMVTRVEDLKIDLDKLNPTIWMSDSCPPVPFFGVFA
ncbi:uncharacterized protein K489DRAFT_385622 [Dissoconium aciculare CBS 342.82]|uniref:Uncharacterized protein n=1 Tax=Dissoconium aciculare CBS 342.82 TaxID=1314786 RepID=A0A6J3LPX3_9PEZI|nr:uncharacterized protein K489DRAFT_385631 [Dissoconium aciculare CBS 342.82]XP_033454739.1 uncharacterized protein K489DRAFT_385622 [Dissoconium aciculare CBS 342.82]KAF1817696.1 hypothetical protein K489DRAFT_385631 [Dissoconium aciculare CBS 342.82]KAF1817703.1 hypothetical protein K489DRAFT_385622 [Dissoconium aciculare CBS 342.82]